MARKPVADVSAWPSITLEGNLIAPAIIASIDRRQAPEQAEEDYRIRKGLTIREEISTAFRVGQSHIDAFAKLTNPSLEGTRRFARDFLKETFGFDDLATGQGAIAFLAGGRVPIVVAPPLDEKLDRRSPTLSTDRASSPASAVQDYLNDHDQALWGLVTNGTVIRLMRDNASLNSPGLYRSRPRANIHERGRSLFRRTLVADPSQPFRRRRSSRDRLCARTMAGRRNA